MPSEKQKIAFLLSLANDDVAPDIQEAIVQRGILDRALTAAEQAEPSNTDGEERRWQRATAVQSRKLQMVLDIPGVKERLQEVTGNPDGYMLAGIEQAEPAPVARTGAVKVKAVLELVQYHVTDDDDRATLTMAISALEPAEPTGFIATLSDDQKKAALNYTGPDSVSAEPAAWRDGKGRTLDRLMSMWRRRDEALDRGEWLGVSEIAGRLVRPKNEVRDELRRLAIDGKIEREDFSNGTFWRGVLPSDITRPPESRLRDALESIDNNTCCSGCQEAALVARAALAQEDGR